MTIKKIILKQLQSYIKKETHKLEELFKKDTTTESQLLARVKNIHYAHQHIRKIKFNDEYDYTERNGKLYYELNGHRLFIMNLNKEDL